MSPLYKNDSFSSLREFRTKIRKESMLAEDNFATSSEPNQYTPFMRPLFQYKTMGDLKNQFTKSK